MAIRFQRLLIACGLPAIIAIVSFYWLRKRRKAVADCRSSPVKHPIIESDKSFELIVVHQLESLGLTQSETYCDSTQINTDYKMQLRDNNNSSTASTAQKACENSNGNMNSDVRTPTTTRIDNIDNNIGFELKRHLKSQNFDSKYSSNRKEIICNYSKVSGDKLVVKVSNNCYDCETAQPVEEGNDEKQMIETNIVNNSETCDTLEHKDCIESEESYSTAQKATVVSHNDNESKSITKFSNDNSFEAKKSTQLLNEDYEQKESHPEMVSKTLNEVNNNCNSDGSAMSQTNSIEPSSSACSSSASCLMANGCDGDVYHNYPDSVTNSAIDHSPPHSAFSDVHSEGSSDSGKGGSDILHVHSSEAVPHATIPDNSVILYQFEIPQYLCGRLIGSGGRFVSQIKRFTNTIVVINKHIYSSDMKICTLTGTKSEIKEALNMIRNRFPFNDYPSVSLQQINLINAAQTCSIPQTCQLQLPSGISCDVILSSMVTAGHFFLQQPTHPTYPSLSRLDQYMSAIYSQVDTPILPQIHSGMICAVPIMGGWFRAVVTKVTDSEECDVMFVDYGGYSRLPVSSLRQIRYDFMSLPFQASECHLANVQPINSETGWTAEANALFEELAQGQILQALVIGINDEGIPLVHLYKVQGVSNVFINKELVNRCHAQWVDSSA